MEWSHAPSLSTAEWGTGEPWTAGTLCRSGGGRPWSVTPGEDYDGTGTDEFLKILNTLGGENVFVISHKQDALVDKFKSTIKFEKIKNFSHIME